MTLRLIVVGVVRELSELAERDEGPEPVGPRRQARAGC